MDITYWSNSFTQDIRFAFRQFIRNPMFSAIAILSLALGIGATTAIFSVMNSMLLRTLRVRDPQQLVMLTNPSESGGWNGLGQNSRDWISYPEFIELRDRLTTLSGLCAAASGLEEYQVRIGGGQQEPTHGRLVSEEYFSVLGVEPTIGRFFNSQDATGPDRDPYAVISYDFWQKRFGGKTDVLGTPIKLNNTILTVVGVAASGFKGETVGENPDFWIPMMMQPSIYPGRDWLHEDSTKSIQKMMWLHAFGRLKPNATLASVQSEVNVVFRGMLQAFYPPTLPPDVKKQAFSQFLVVRDARTGAFSGRDEFASQLKILLTVAGLVLLIACANVANLLLEKAMARQREVGVRLSIGAPRLRLFRQFLTESLLLSGLAGGIGLLIAFGAVRVLVSLLSDPTDPLDLPTGLDWRVLAFTATVTLFTGVLFGIVPALRASRVKMNISMREGGASGGYSGRRVSFSKIVVIGQVALSLLLIVGAGLFVRTLWNLQSVALGYPKEHLLQVRVDGVTAGYQEQALLDFYRDIANRLGELPGVRGVAYSQLGLLTGGETQGRIEAEGFIPQRDEDRASRFNYISPGYFAVLGVPMVLGRDIGSQDTATSQKVCVINEELARRFFAGQNPIGRHITKIANKLSDTMEIVGVAKNVRSSSLRAEIPQRIYTPLSQAFLGKVRGAVIFEIRTAGEPKSMLSASRTAILASNPDAPITFAYTMEELIARQTLAEGQIARLCLVFGALALLLAAMGLYGVLSNGVARRANEIGLRMALGANRSNVILMVLRESGILVVIGMALGVIAAGMSTRAIATKLYGLSQMDPLTIAFALALLGAVALVAGYIPAARAAKVNPIQALRHQ